MNNFLNLIGLGSIKIYGFWGVILAHVFFNLPLAIRILLQAFNDMPGEQYRLVSSLKLSSAQKFLVLEWPVLKKVCPGVWAVIFAICLSSFAVALTLGGGPKATTVELAIYQSFFYDLDFSKAAQLALVQIVLVFSVVVASQFIVKPKTYIPNAATKNETGIPKAVIKATREFKNKYKERSNKNKPIKPDDLTVSNLVLTFFEKSLKTDT